MRNRSSYKTLSAAFALLMIIGLSSEAFALSDGDAKPMFAPVPDLGGSLTPGADRVPVAVMFTASSRNWTLAREKALKAARSYYGGTAFKVVSERKWYFRVPDPEERFRVTIWTIPCL